MVNQIDYDQLDGATQVGRKHAGVGTKLGLAALGVGLVTALVFINWPRETVSQDPITSDEEFRTTEFEPPNLPQSPQQPEQTADQIVVPSPNETPPQQAGNVEQTVEEGVDLDAQRRALEAQLAAEEARRRAAEEEARRQREAEEAARMAAEEEERRRLLEERLRSPQMVLDGNNNAGRDGQMGGEAAMQVAPDGQLVPVPGAESDPNKAFLAQSEAASNAAAVASINRRTDATVSEGTMIRGFLETAINTDLPGMVRAVIREDVYSLDGRRVLIPKGSRLVGEYRSGLARGQKRVFVVWNRIIRSDGVSVRIGSPGTDNLGRGGMGGRVDTHWLERYGSAIMLSVVGGAAEYLSSLADPDDDGISRVITIDPITGQQIITEYGSGRDEARAIAFERGSDALQELATEAFRDSQSIPPTIHIDQGTPVIVFVRRDLDFSALYADPVQEEISRLKRGGKPRRAIDPTPLYPPTPSPLGTGPYK